MQRIARAWRAFWSEDGVKPPDPPKDFSEFLRHDFAQVQVSGKEKAQPRFKMSERNRRKMDRIRQRVAELRGQ